MSLITETYLEGLDAFNSRLADCVISHALKVEIRTASMRLMASSLAEARQTPTSSPAPLEVMGPTACRCLSARGSPTGGAAVAKMASHAIFQYNVLVIGIDNTTLGLM